MLGKLLKEPFLYFLLIGGSIFLGYSQVSNQSPQINLTDEITAQLIQNHISLGGDERNLTQKVMANLIDNYIDGEVLYREAIKRGLHENDPQTRSRMIQSMQFLLGGQLKAPDDQTLLAYYEENSELYKTGAKISFGHYFYLDNPSDKGLGLLESLSQNQPPKTFDEFWLGNTLVRYEEPVLKEMLGGDFLNKIKELDLNIWAGPFQSTRGFHFVKVSARQPERTLSFGFVKDRVLEDWYRDQKAQKIKTEVIRLKETYSIHIPEN